MEVQEGFIVGIYNYCDSWCERCAFTSRCRVFAGCARSDAAGDPTFKPVIDAPQHRSDVRKPPAWLVELFEQAQEVVEQAIKQGTLTTESLNDALPDLHASVSKRARDYAFRVFDFWRDRRVPADDGARLVVMRYSTLISSKVYRAMSGLAEFDGNRDFPPDHEGSAKVALMVIDHSAEAWRRLIASGDVPGTEAGPFLADLEWLRLRLDELIPRGRAFVRPGFDEPEEVKRLEATDFA